VHRKSKSPPCPSKERRDKDGAPASGANARFVFYALRGAEAAALPRYSEAFGMTTGKVKNNIRVKSGAAGVRGSHLSQKARKMGHPLLFLVQEVKQRD
jgi:hypothetical protein